MVHYGPLGAGSLLGDSDSYGRSDGSATVDDALNRGSDTAKDDDDDAGGLHCHVPQGSVGAGYLLASEQCALHRPAISYEPDGRLEGIRT